MIRKGWFVVLQSCLWVRNLQMDFQWRVLTVVSAGEKAPAHCCDSGEGLCSVSGVSPPQVAFNLAVPCDEAWNGGKGHLQLLGNGGFLVVL